MKPYLSNRKHDIRQVYLKCTTYVNVSISEKLNCIYAYSSHQFD